MRQELEQAGYDWLGSMVESMCDEDPSDIAYSADQMVDAFIAGACIASCKLRPSVLELRTAIIEQLGCYNISGTDFKENPALRNGRRQFAERFVDRVFVELFRVLPKPRFEEREPAA